MTELKPCPVCGKKPERCTGYGYDILKLKFGSTFSVSGYHIECFNCLKKTEVHSTMEEAEKEWNDFDQNV